MDLQSLQIETSDEQTFIQLPNGEFIELSLSGSKLSFDHRSTLDGNSIDALIVETILEPEVLNTIQCHLYLFFSSDLSEFEKCFVLSDTEQIKITINESVTIELLIDGQCIKPVYLDIADDIFNETMTAVRVLLRDNL